MALVEMTMPAPCAIEPPCWLNPGGSILGYHPTERSCPMSVDARLLKKLRTPSTALSQSERVLAGWRLESPQRAEFAMMAESICCARASIRAIDISSVRSPLLKQCWATRSAKSNLYSGFFIKPWWRSRGWKLPPEAIEFTILYLPVSNECSESCSKNFHPSGFSLL